MGVDLTTAAELMEATYHKRGFFQQWRKISEIRHGRGGLDAAAYQRGDEIVVCIEGQRPWTPQDILAMGRRLLARKGLITDAYPDSGERFVRWLQAANPDSTITMVGHSGGCGWAALIAKRLGLECIAFNGGADALRTRPGETDHDKVLSVEIAGDKWGDSSRKRPPLRARVVRLKQPAGMSSHFMPAIIKALAVQGAHSV